MPADAAPQTVTPTLVHTPGHDTCSSLLADLVAKDADRILLEHKGPDGSWQKASRAAVASHVLGVKKGPVAPGVPQGAAVSLRASTRDAWVLIDVTIRAVGAVTVPLHTNSSASRVAAFRADAALARQHRPSESPARARALTTP